MIPPKTEKQVITQTYSHDINLKNHPQVSMDVDRFDAAILNKGYNVYHYRALRCPCVVRQTGSPLPNCENCSGMGWFYIDKTKTKALMQGMGNAKKFEPWSETNAGGVTITTLYEDDVSYMDKFEIIDLEGNFSQILYPQVYNGNLFSFTIYEPVKMMNIYQFLDSKQPLKPLYSKDEKPSDWDYYVDRNKIILNNTKFSLNDDNLSISVRYKHTPVYCVIDITRELFKTKDQECAALCDEKDLSFRGMPQRSMGRRLHYIWNANNYDGIKDFDNTVYPEDPSILI